MEYFQKIPLYKRREFGEKINTTFSFLRQNGAAYFKAQLFISGPVGVLCALLYAFFISNIQMTSRDPNAFLSVMTSSTYMGNLGIIMLIFFFLILSISLVTYSYFKEYELGSGQNIAVLAVFARVKKNFLPILFASLLVYLISAIGFVLLILPGIYISVVGVLAIPIVVLENKGPFEALDRAFKLIRDKWWSTFGLIIVTSIIAGIVRAVFSLPVTIANVVVGIHQVNNQVGQFTFVTSPLMAFIYQLIIYIGTILGYSIVQSAMCFQYYNLVEMKEARGLMDEINQINKEDNSRDEGEY